MKKLSQNQAGNVGESLVITRLLSWGYPTTWCNGGFKYDVICDVDNVPYRIQVKAASRIYKKAKYNPKRPGYQFSMTTGNTHKGSAKKTYSAGDYDILACVSIPERRIIFSILLKSTTKRYYRSDFNKDNELMTWEETLKKLLQ